MYTLCPHCSTCFRLTAEHLNAAHGNVRCGNCGAIFNALDNPAPAPDLADEMPDLERDNPLLQDDSPLDDPWDPGGGEQHLNEPQPDSIGSLKEEPTEDGLWDLDTPDDMARLPDQQELYREQEFTPLGGDASPPPTPAPLGKSSPEGKTPLPDLPEATEEKIHESCLENMEDYTIEELEKLFLGDDEEPQPPPPDPGTAQVAEQPASLPATASERLPDSTPHRPATSILDNWMLTSAGSLLLILLLLGQYIWITRDYLAQHYPESRPLLGEMCQWLGCRLALRRDPDRLHITHRDVRTHPTAKEALLINATFVNRAPFRQPYPLIELRLSNLRGEEIGSRTFLPREYLAGEPDIKAGIPPDGLVYLVLEIADPGRHVVNFEFKFL